MIHSKIESRDCSFTVLCLASSSSVVSSNFNGFYLGKGSRTSSSLPHGSLLLSSISGGGSVSQGSSNLAVLGQVEGSDLLGLLNLLLVALDLTLELVNQSLHALVVLLVLVSSEGEFLDGSLSLAEVLQDISVASALSVKLGLQLTDAGLHLDHCLPSSLEGIDLGLVSTGTSVLALGLQQLLVLLEGHGQLLLASELISKTSSINHSSCSLLFRQSGLVGHLIEVALELVVFRLQLPPGSSNGLVDVGEVSQVLVCVSQLLLGSTSLPISSLQQGTGLLEAVLHGGGLAVGGDLGVGSSGLGLRLGVDLDLSISDLELVLLDGGLGLSVASNGMFKSQAEVSRVGLQL